MTRETSRPFRQEHWSRAATSESGNQMRIGRWQCLAKGRLTADPNRQQFGGDGFGREYVALVSDDGSDWQRDHDPWRAEKIATVGDGPRGLSSSSAEVSPSPAGCNTPAQAQQSP